jgi:hypothetical protein
MHSHRSQTVLCACLFLGLFCGVSVSRGAEALPIFSGTTTVSGRVVAGYLLVVPVTVNGRGPWDFVVDTGTNQTVLDPALAKELRLARTGQVALNTLAGQQKVSLASVDSISVGKASVQNLEILVGSIDVVRSLDGRVRGVLGLDFLYHFAFSLDYEHTRLRLFPPTLLADPENPGSASVEVQLIDGRLLVPCSWQDTAKGLLALDSGIADVLLFGERRAGDSTTNSGARRQMLVSNSAATEVVRISLADFLVGQQRVHGVRGLLLARTAEMTALREDGLLPAWLFQSVFVNLHARIAVFKQK